jgi:flagellar hook-associated protein 3 FlgL
MDTSHDRVLLARGRAGEWLNRADAQEFLMKDRVVDLETEQSRLTDIDLVKGISDFQKQQLALDAALKSYAQVQRLSLFNQI